MAFQNDGGLPAGSPGEKASQMLNAVAAKSDRNLAQSASPFKHPAAPRKPCPRQEAAG